jgi:hypothetical protein
MAKKVMIKIAPPSGDPNKPVDNNMILTANDPTRTGFDLRDKLAELVGKGNNLSADDKMAIYGGLTTMLGKDKAAKVMNHAYLFNSRPDVQKLGMEDKLRSFYTVGSNDPDVHAIIEKSKNLGYGVVPGFRQSSSAINQVLSGQTPATAGASLDPEVQRKVMLQVRK